MEKNVGNDVNGFESENFDNVDSEENCDCIIDGDDDSVSSESEALLTSRKGGISRGFDKTERKVQWNDRNGDKLAEILEYQPSSHGSDSDDDDKDSCNCTVM